MFEGLSQYPETRKALIGLTEIVGHFNDEEVEYYVEEEYKTRELAGGSRNFKTGRQVFTLKIPYKRTKEFEARQVGMLEETIADLEVALEAAKSEKNRLQKIIECEVCDNEPTCDACVALNDID